MASLLELKNSVAIQPAPVASSNAAFNRLASAFDSAANLTAKVGRQRLNQMAKERQAELQAAKVSATIDIRDNIDRLKNEHLDPRNFNLNSDESFRNAAAGYLEGVLPSVPEGARVAVENAAKLYTQKAVNQIDSRLRVVAGNRMRADIEESYTKLRRDAENLAYDGDAVTAAGINGQVDQKLQAALDSGLINAEKYVSLKESMTKSLQENTYLGQFNRALANETHEQPLPLQEQFKSGQKYLEQFEKAKNAGLSPQEKERLSIKMRGVLRQRKQGIQVRTQKLEEEMRDMVARVERGENPENLAVLSATVNNLLPAKSLKFQRDIENAKTFSTVADAIRYVGLDEKEGATRALRENLDPSQEGFDSRIKTINKIDREAKTQAREFENDPNEYVLSSPEVQNAIKSYNESGERHVLDPREDEKNLFQIVAQASLSMQGNMGLPEEKRRVLSAARAAEIAQRVRSTGDIALQTAIITEEADKAGKYSRIAMRDLRRAGIPQATMLLRSMTQNIETLHLVPQATEAWNSRTSDLEKALSIPTKDMRLDVQNTIAPFVETLGNGATTSVINNLGEQIYKVSLVLARTQSREDAIQNASQIILSNYQFDSFNGRAFRMPANPALNTRQLTGLGTILKQSLRKSGTPFISGDTVIEGKNFDIVPPAFYYPELEPEAKKIAYRGDLISGAHFQNLPDDSGVFVADSYGAPVRLTSGETLKFKFSDLMDPSSDLNEFINEQSLTLIESLDSESLLSRVRGRFNPFRDVEESE